MENEEENLEDDGDVEFEIEIDNDVYAEIEKIALETGVSVNDVLVKILREEMMKYAIHACESDATSETSEPGEPSSNG